MSVLTMTPRQRVEATLHNGWTDRAPTYVPALSCQVASELLGRPTYAGTGELHFYEVRAWAQGEQAHAEFEARLQEDMLAWHRHLDLDVFREPWRMNVRPTRQLDDYRFLFGDPDGEHNIWQYNPNSGDFACVASVKHEMEPEERLRLEVEHTDAHMAQYLQTARNAVARAAARQQKLGEQFAYVESGGPISIGLGSDNMMALALAPELMRRKTMALAQIGVAFGAALAETQVTKALLGGGDLAGITGPMYSPAMFREVVLPAYKYLLERLNDTGVHYVFRSDGNIWSLADMLFREAQCPGFGEVDRDATMTAAALRQRYPRLVIWGNISSALLVKATPQQVRDEARRTLDETGGRGYFLGCSNAIVMGTPPANVEALFSAR